MHVARIDKEIMKDDHRSKERYFIELTIGTVLLSLLTTWVYYTMGGLFGYDPLLLWNSAYYREYRWGGLVLYTIGRWLTTSYGSPVLILLFLSLSWRMKKAVSKSTYKWMNRGFLLGLLLFSGALIGGVFRLMM